MQRLTQGDLPEWLGRFNNFYDSVIRVWRITYEKEVVCDVVIKTRDSRSPSSWSRVEISIRNPRLARFGDSSNESFIVISDGLNVIFTDDEVGIEMGAFYELPGSLEKLATSPCCVIGRELEWKAEFQSYVAI